MEGSEDKTGHIPSGHGRKVGLKRGEYICEFRILPPFRMSGYVPFGWITVGFIGRVYSFR